jgi:hypothetical protein
VVDRVLAATHDDRVRSGAAFATSQDQGFELRSFAFRSMASVPDSPASFAALRLLFEFAGRFLPVEAAIDGDAIRSLPTRLAIVPVQAPVGLHTRAGDPDLSIPLRMDLRSLNGASPRVIARMRGAAPPGTLVGDGTNVPPGNWKAFVPDASGVVTIVYRPPAALVGGDVRIELETALSRPSEPAVRLAEVAFEVRSA